ncbi:glucose-repressible gene protein [Xylariaceae sp. FL0016]|nr:glucose-repressible gene protein [Xylariaceae sp. FL0016]
MDKVSNAANYVSDTVKGAVSTGSKEANKEVAKDNNVGLGDRAKAAGNALSDKKDESSYNTSASVNKEAAKH